MLGKMKRKRPPARLGRSGEDYLEAVLVLSRGGRIVRVKDVAKKLSVSRPSVVAGLAKLERQGLVKHERYGAVELTRAGAKVAESVDERHRLLFSFLHDALELPPKRAATDACALEHALSPETAASLLRFVERRRWPVRHGVRPRKERSERGR
jgi:DtxR family Mn-dependent transcriptional regulator